MPLQRIFPDLKQVRDAELKAKFLPILSTFASICRGFYFEIIAGFKKDRDNSAETCVLSFLSNANMAAVVAIST